jgi:flagellar hook-length control protein FliK
LSQVERAYQQSSAANSDKISTIKYDGTKGSYKPDNAIENFKIKESVESVEPVDSVESVDLSHTLDGSSHFIESLKRDFDDSTQDQDTRKNNQQSLDLKEPLDKSFDPRLMSVSAGINSKDAPQSIQSAGILDANYERIHQAAQLLVEKGGGSARIKLSPEGMGEIELRIRVQGDHVNVHFVAENVETKEIFEESIQNLKSQLEAQNLKVESLNIQIADVKSHNFADSGREHSQSNPNLGLLRDMMNQSRDESFARQSNTFSEWESIRSYGRRAPSSPAPISSALETHAKLNRYQGDRRGRRLSLVG